MAGVLRLQPGEPHIIAFKFESGKDVKGGYGPQVAFTAIERESGEDKVLYLDPEPANDVERELKHLGIRTREYFRLTKVKQPRGGSRIQIERIEAPTGTTASAPASHSYSAPAGVQPIATQPTERAQVNTAAAELPSNVSTKFMSAYAAAIDTLIEARTYAQRKGLALEIRCEDVRCLAATIMIDQKGGAR